MTPFESYVAPARINPGWWRILLGVVLIGVLWIVGAVVVLIGWVLYQFSQLGDINAALGTMAQVMRGGSPVFITVMLLSFVGVWGGIVAVQALHGQSFASVFAPDSRPRRGGFVAGVFFALIFILPALGTALLVTDPIRSDVSIASWLIWLIPLAFLINLQTTAEEMIFRGYLQQQLGARSRLWIVWAGIPSVLFGLLHYANADTVEGGIYYMLITGFMGLLLAGLVWRTGSLWTACGVHWANNFFALTVIGPSGVLSGTQLWNFEKGDDLILLQVDLVVVAIATLLVLSPVGRIFGDGRNTAFRQSEAEAFA
ncbi:MAG: type II CAAX endopeptidase family protein [Pseudomonadota bacterium]